MKYIFLPSGQIPLLCGHDKERSGTMKASESHIRIFVEELRVNVRIGLYASEVKPQKLDVSISLYAPPSYLKGVSEDSIIDYKKLHDAVKTWEGRDHVKLLESYAKELLDIAFTFKPVVAAKISIAKAEIFANTKGAGIEVFVTRKDYKKM
jgi:7,8-dihydroneopterin aldolase/epimerase/oxygenase